MQIINKINHITLIPFNVMFKYIYLSIIYFYVSDAMPALLYKFSEQTLQPGPSVSLKCIAKGNPPPSIQWLLDGFPIQRSER